MNGGFQGSYRLALGGERIEVGNRIGRGGEGEAYFLASHPRLAAKFFFEHKRAAIVPKVQEMLVHRPRQTSFQSHTIFTWPEDLILDAAEQPIGYVMPRIHDAEKLYKLKHPASRKNDRRTRAFFYDRLVSIARNLAKAVDFAHDQGLIVGDLNAQNVLVLGNTNVSLIDVDSFQFVDGRGQYHPCTVGTPEYLAPELIGQNLASVRRDPSSDLFSLGILLYELLMEGQHPYAGIDKGRPGPADVASRIKHGLFPRAASRQVDVELPRASPPREMLGPEVLALFHRCFDEGHFQPALRPTAREWRSVLKAWSQILRAGCPANPEHIFDRRLSFCPWCWRQAAGARTPTPAPVAAQTQAPPMPRPQQASHHGGASSGPTTVRTAQSRPSLPTPRARSRAWSYLAVPATALLVVPVGYQVYSAVGPRGLGEPCVSANECGSGICTARRCALAKSVMGERCTANEDCATGVCTLQACRECRQSSDCPATRICKDNTCVKAALGDSCEKDTQCEGALVCVSGGCAERVNAPAIVDTPPAPIPTPFPSPETPEGSRPVPEDPKRTCPTPEPWDNQVRGWAKDGSSVCTSGSDVRRGYYLRIAVDEGPDVSKEAIRRAWRKYVDEYLGSASCPEAMEMVFFDPARSVGAGILFRNRPPNWSKVAKGEPDWLLRDNSLNMVDEQVCFFGANDERRRLGW
ncbi:protein kinase domain-containing protein [Polyangium mundeleinium]|uniref:Protein kinase n=1 Tax=Polyangium mundeleinium TaxID=2995306 RepID=A0ABT5EIE1_9BACT|nr:protein kinase [Polyangium mundeleinium]MDC0741585.1 protein kinase [Polyangium mundeleinium]